MKSFQSKRKHYEKLYEANASVIQNYNERMLSNFSLMTGLLMILPMLAIPFSQSKSQILDAYVLTGMILFFIHFIYKAPFMKRWVKLGLYVGFSIFMIFSMYLSLIHTPDMRATVLLVVFCMMQMVFIDYPHRMNSFTVAWFLIHGLLAFYLKPDYALDDIINTLGSMIVGIFIGNKMLWVRLEGYDAYRLRTIERETDVLTGLYNRRKLFETMVSIEEDVSIQMPKAAVMIDIDHFKILNDTFGHAQGDNYLKQVGQLLQSFVEKYDFQIFRYGGEEFLALAHCYTQEELLTIAEEIRQSFKQIFVADYRTSASIGVAYAQDNHSRNLDRLINRADKAVYTAKHKGRDQVEYLPFN